MQYYQSINRDQGTQHDHTITTARTQKDHNMHYQSLIMRQSRNPALSEQEQGMITDRTKHYQSTKGKWSEQERKMIGARTENDQSTNWAWSEHEKIAWSEHDHRSIIIWSQQDHSTIRVRSETACNLGTLVRVPLEIGKIFPVIS